ncbi:MAG: hypothetical protein ACYC0J_00855 [Gammaproteobacteria bacterium]
MATNRPTFNPIDFDKNNRGEMRVEQDGTFAVLSLEVIQNIVGNLDNQSLARLSRSYSSFYVVTQAQRDEARLSAFLKAVVDDDRLAVKRMLENNPNLLLMTPPKGMKVTTRAWQTFYAEAAPLMAAKCGQIEMLKIMRPYFDCLPDQAQANAQLEAVRLAWPYKTQQNTQGFDEIIIPEAYTYYANALVDAFIVEPIQDNAHLSESAQSAFLACFNMLLPKVAVHLDDYVNPELWLLALLKVYWSRNDFQTRKQLDAFCVRLIGLAQSVLSVESAKIFCEGLYRVVEEKKEISERARELQLNDDQTLFYPSKRPSVDSITGLGFHSFCGFYNGRGDVGQVEAWVRGGLGVGRRWCWKTYVEQKQRVYGELCSESQRSQDTPAMMVANR